jgi:hypothetical protein
MGMFDYIRCDAPLPDGWSPGGPLQTKDFDCEMVCHVITNDGKLMLERIDATHIVPKAERPYPNEPDDSILGMCGMLRINTGLYESDFHGVVNFYGHDENDRWHEYKAKFTDGRLVKIEIVDDE